MSAPTTKQEWQDAADELSSMRSGLGPDEFADALGFNGESFGEWAADDAVDTLMNVIPEAMKESGATFPQVLASCFATHSQIGVELGIWLVRTGRVAS